MRLIQIGLKLFCFSVFNKEIVMFLGKSVGKFPLDYLVVVKVGNANDVDFIARQSAKVVAKTTTASVIHWLNDAGKAVYGLLDNRTDTVTMTVVTDCGEKAADAAFEKLLGKDVEIHALAM